MAVEAVAAAAAATSTERRRMVSREGMSERDTKRRGEEGE